MATAPQTALPWHRSVACRHLALPMFRRTAGRSRRWFLMRPTPSRRGRSHRAARALSVMSFLHRRSETQPRIWLRPHADPRCGRECHKPLALPPLRGERSPRPPRRGGLFYIWQPLRRLPIHPPSRGRAADSDGLSQPLHLQRLGVSLYRYSTVTLLARLRGWSTSVPFTQAT